MVETLKDPSSESHSGSNPKSKFQNIDELLDELQGDGNSMARGSDLRSDARLSKLIGKGEMNIDLDELIHLDSELLKSQKSSSLIKEPKSPVQNESPLFDRLPRKSLKKNDDLLLSGASYNLVTPS